MHERRRQRRILKVDHYDGQCIFSGHELLYELGGYLGGGAAGVVYEAFSTRTKHHVAVKILNPVGYKLLPSTMLMRCIVVIKGKPLEASALRSLEMQVPPTFFHDCQSPTAAPPHMKAENVWWLIHPTTKQVVAAYEDARTGMLREMTLPQCMDVWGEALNVDNLADCVDQQCAQLEEAYSEAHVMNQVVKIPRIPKKFVKFAHTRRLIHREVANMSSLDAHPNVLRLDDALELVQDSKCTTFLVLELAAGGELFDRIKLDCGTDEETARRYCRQLISGVAFCHLSGICHRDLKPENLLLAESEEFSTLKIADFGLSAIFAMTEEDDNPQDQPSTSSLSATSARSAAVHAIRRLRSVVGSPYYVAPEVLVDNGQGYDGAKADAWSIGVILYAMLAGNLPFGKDLLTCLRYEKFKNWSYSAKYSDEDPIDDTAFPSWLFPPQFSLEAKSLVTQLLCPDPTLRLSVEDAQHHPWVLGESLRRRNNSPIENDPLPATPSGVPIQGNISTGSHNRLNVAVGTVQVRADRDLRIPQVMIPSPGGFKHRQIGCSPHEMSLCSTSPQQPQSLQPLQRTPGGYMPSVDETSPMSCQTPPASPVSRQNEAALVAPVVSDADAPMLFDMDQDFQEDSETLKTDECPSPDNHELRAPTSVQVPKSLARAVLDLAPRTLHRPQRRFTSPPIVQGGRTSWLPRRHQCRRNSPPELFHGRLERGIKFEALHHLDLDIERFGTSMSLSSTPTECSMLERVAQELETPDAKRGRATGATQQDSASVIATPKLTDPPSYCDLVSRSTRFLTSVPAHLVLSKIEAILTSHASPLPSPFTNVPQRVSTDWDKYQLEVHFGSVLSCTVRLFLFQRGVYLVEFRRGQIDIFQFKRFYEDIRDKLLETIHETAQDDLSSRTCACPQQPDDNSVPCPTAHCRRKRNHSVGVAPDNDLLHL